MPALSGHHNAADYYTIYLSLILLQAYTRSLPERRAVGCSTASRTNIQHAMIHIAAYIIRQLLAYATPACKYAGLPVFQQDEHAMPRGAPPSSLFLLPLNSPHKAIAIAYLMPPCRQATVSRERKYLIFSCVKPVYI